MKQNTLNFVATVVLAFVLAQFLPWWSVMLAALLSGLFVPLKGGAVFIVPFLTIAVFWIAYAGILSYANDFTLAKKIAILLPLNGNTSVLLLLTGLVGGIAAGVAGILGRQCREVVS